MTMKKGIQTLSLRTRRLGVAEAKSKLSEVLREAAQGPTVIHSRGRDLVVVLALFALFGFTLTLPGIAGILLTVGMGVDANVLILERVREELRDGKSARAAVDAQVVEGQCEFATVAVAGPASDHFRQHARHTELAGRIER